MKPSRKVSVTRPRGDAKSLPPTWATIALLAVSICAVYGPALRVPFIYDDNFSILANKSITKLWPLVGSAEDPGPLQPPPRIPTTRRPLVNLSFAVNYRLGGLSPEGYHAFNMGLHFLSALVLWQISVCTLRLPRWEGQFRDSAGWLALCVALLWALHPLQTESVIYATQRTELMVGLFYLLTIYCSLRYWELYSPPTQTMARSGALMSRKTRQTLRAGWFLLAVASCLAGAASKEVIVTAPLVVLLFERTFVTGSLTKALRQSWPLYAGLATTWVLLYALSFRDQYTGSVRLPTGVPIYVWWATQAEVVMMYLKLAFWPWPLLIHYRLPYLGTLAGACMYVVPVMLLAIGTLVLLWRNHPAGFLGAFVFLVLSPTSAMPIITEMAAERRMYLPLAAIVALVVVGGYWLGERVIARRTAPRRAPSSPWPRIIAVCGLTIVVALAWALVSSQRLGAYANEMDLWQEVLKQQPQNDVAHVNVGYHLQEAENLPAAVDHYREAIRLNPESTEGHIKLADAMVLRGDYREAAPHLTIAAGLDPTNPVLRRNLASALVMCGRSNEAAVEFRAALDLNPNDASTHSNFGKFLSSAGNVGEAIKHLEQAARLEPESADDQYDLAAALQQDGQSRPAIEHFESALRIKPDLAPAYAGLARALAAADRSEEAIASAQKGIEVGHRTGQDTVAGQIEDWLQHYKIELRRSR